MHKILILFISLIFFNCCPFSHSDCFCTIEKDFEVRSIKEYPNTKYFITAGEYEWKDSIQELFYTRFSLYIDYINVYDIKEHFSVKAYISNENNIKAIDSSEIRISYKTTSGYGVFIKRKFYEPKIRLKIIITKEDKNDVIFEFDLEQKSKKRKHSRKFESFIQT